MLEEADMFIPVITWYIYVLKYSMILLKYVQLRFLESDIYEIIGYLDTVYLTWTYDNC